MKKQNAIWIEFETNPPTPEAIKLMNRMLARLGVDMYFITNVDNELFIGTKAEQFGYKKLLDNGEWFSLDYMGRED